MRLPAPGPDGLYARTALHHIGPAVYSGAWLLANEQDFWIWAQARADSRGWLDNNLGDWQLLKSVHCTTAMHILRVLYDGVRGPERNRTAEQRYAAPRRCQ